MGPLSGKAIEDLIEDAKAAVHREPAEARVKAELALCRARLFAGSRVARWVLLWRAQTALGNAQRAGGDFLQARRTLAEAARLVSRPEQPVEVGLLLEARCSVYSSLVSLQRDQGLFGLAQGTAAEGIRLAASAGELRLASQLMVDLAGALMAEGYEYRLRGSFLLARTAARLLPLDNPYRSTATQMVIACIAQSSDIKLTPDKARALNADLEQMRDTASGQLGKLRLGWLQAKVAMNGGLPCRALLEELCRDFASHGQPHMAAMCLLDLSLLLLKEGDAHSAAQVNTMLFPLFRRLRRDREAVAALVMLRDAVEANRLDEELAREIEERLSRSDRSQGSY